MAKDVTSLAAAELLFAARLAFSICPDVQYKYMIIKSLLVNRPRVIAVTFFHRFSTYPLLDIPSGLPVSSRFR